MPLQMFPLLVDNTRLIRFKDTLYKVKVKYKLATFPTEGFTISQTDAHNEIEEVFRAVLYINERNKTLKTIATPNFLIQTLKVPWSFPSKCSDYEFQQNGKSLKVFDHMFEFHVSNNKNDSINRSKEEVIPCADNRLNFSDRQYQAEKMGCKPALVIVSDLNLDAAARFGRTKDGQLYKVCASSGNINRDHTSTNNDTNEKTRVIDKVLAKSFEEVIDKNVSNVKSAKLRDDKVVTETDRGERPLLASDKHVTSKHAKRSDNKSSKKEKEDNSSVAKAKTNRDKYSLRESELKALGYENIQECRLRRRKPSGEKNLARSRRDKATAVIFTELESSQTEAGSSQTEAGSSQSEAEGSQSEAEGSQTEAGSSQSEAERRGRHNRSNTYITNRKTGHVRRTTLKLSERKRKRSVLTMRKGAIDVSNKTKKSSEQTETDSDTEGGISDNRVLHSSGQQNNSSSLNSGSESRQSPRKADRSNKKRKMDCQSDDEKSASQESGRSKKVRLYGVRNSPQIITEPGSSRTVEVCSPLVSTVLPLKRNPLPSSQSSQRTVPAVTSPRLTRQSISDTEARRIASLREERPSQIYRDIMLSQRRDRHLVEQAENAETDKLRQLYEPTVPRRSPRLNRKQEGKTRRSSGLWGKIMEALVTPTKKYMFGNKK